MTNTAPVAALLSVWAWLRTGNIAPVASTAVNRILDILSIEGSLVRHFARTKPPEAVARKAAVPAATGRGLIGGLSQKKVSEAEKKIQAGRKLRTCVVNSGGI